MSEYKDFLIIRNTLQQQGYEVYKLTLPNQLSRVEVHKNNELVFENNCCISSYDAACKLKKWWKEQHEPV
jgi:hypothetical protein